MDGKKFKSRMFVKHNTFCPYISDIEIFMMGAKRGEVVVGKQKLLCWYIYADDLATVTKTEELKAMNRNFRRYIEEKILFLNTSKIDGLQECSKKKYRWE